MSDTDNEKPKLGMRAPLGLRRTVETSKVKQSFSHGRSNTVIVETKKRRFTRTGETAPDAGPEIEATAAPVEAQAAGTPVIAYPLGSMPEIIDDCKTGFLVSDIAGAVDAVKAAAGLDRTAIRSSTIERFDVLRMIDDYVAVYRAILQARE